MIWNVLVFLCVIMTGMCQTCDLDVKLLQKCICDSGNADCTANNYCFEILGNRTCAENPKCVHNDGKTKEEADCYCSGESSCEAGSQVCHGDGGCGMPECETGGTAALSVGCLCTSARDPSVEEICTVGKFCYNTQLSFEEERSLCSQNKPKMCIGNGISPNPWGDPCRCGEKGSIFCRQWEYCNSGVVPAQCSEEPNPTCANINGNGPNGNTACVCGTKTCQPYEYCNASSTTRKCYKQYCHDYESKQPDFCNRRGSETTLIAGANDEAQRRIVAVPYGNGVVPNKTCEVTAVEGECTDDSFEECCVPCPLERTFDPGTNQCLEKCNYTICEGKWVEPPFGYPRSLSEVWDESSVEEHLNKNWTGFCHASCDATDQETCCVKAKKCTEAAIFCTESKHTGKFIVDATCANHQCDQDQCCEVVECNCTGGDPMPASTCSGHGAHECQSCDENYWKDGLLCTPIENCTTEQYQVEPPRPGVQNRVCAALTVCNNVSQYISINETRDSSNMALTNRTCSTLTVCMPHEYQVRVPTRYQDRTCSNLTVCNSSEFATIQRKGTLSIADAVCNPLTQCDNSSYISFAGNATADRECENITSVCVDPEVQLREPIPGVSNRVCGTPVNCTSDQYETKAPTNMSVRECTVLTLCTANQYQSSPPNSTSDRTCTDLTVCRAADQYESVAATNTSDRKCANLTVCDPNKLEYETTAPNATRNRICATCTNASCKTCTTKTDCDYAPGKIHDPSKCSNKICTRYNVRQEGVFTNATNETISELVLEYGLYYRFDVDSSMSFTVSGIEAYTNRTLRDNAQISNNEYLYFYIPMGHVGDITYKALGTSNTTFLIKRNCNQTIKYMGSKDGKQVCTSVCGGPGAILVKRTTVYGAIGGGTPCLPVWTSTPCLCVPQGECPADFNGTCVHTDCQCPVNCEYEEDDDFGPCEAACGEKGLQTKGITIKTAPRHDGKACPPNEERECTGAPDYGKCDCDGHTLDRCGVCGGHNECRGCDGIYYTVRGYKIPVMDECGNCPCTNRNNQICASSEQKRACRDKLKLKAVRKTERSDRLRRNVPLYVGGGLVAIFVVVIACICRRQKKSYIPVAAHDPGASFEHMDNLLRF